MIIHYLLKKKKKTTNQNFYRTIFGCLHNSLNEVYKNPDKDINLNESKCPSVIDIRIKYLNSEEKNNDPYLKVNLFILVY